VRLKTLYTPEVAQLPDRVRAKFDAVAAALTRHPAEWPRDSEIEAMQAADAVAPPLNLWEASSFGMSRRPLTL
jgi:hypothetical protein